MEDGVIKIEIELDSLTSVSLVQNSQSILRAISVENTGKNRVERYDIIVESDPKFFEPFVIAGVESESVTYTDLPLAMSYTALTSFTQSISANVNVSVKSGDKLLGTKSKSIKLLPFDEFSGEGASEIIASFCLPSDPFVGAVIAKAGAVLSQQGLSFCGYGGDADMVRKQLAAIYSSIQSYKFNLCVPPPDFESKGQRIKLPSRIENGRMMTCLDATLLFCACAEGVGLNPLVIFTKGRTIFGCWLTDKTFSDVVCEQSTSLTLRMAEGVNEIAVIDSISTTRFTEFENAALEAENVLKSRKFSHCVDIARARQLCITPLPLQVEEGAYKPIFTKKENVLPTIHETVDLTKVDLTGGTTQNEKSDRFEKWKRELLDVSLNNPLINFRIDKAGIPLLATSPEDIEDVLWQEKTLMIFPRPKQLNLKSLSIANLIADEAALAVIKSGLDTQKVYSILEEGELYKRLTEIYRNAKNATEETGANTLYLALGFLKWFERDSIKGAKDENDKARFAPIVLLPVELMRKSVRSGYSMRIRDDEAQINLSLIEALRVNFEIDASELKNLPHGEMGLDLKKVYTMLRRIIMNLKGWDVIETASISVFNYSRFVMYNDLIKRSEQIKAHPIVKSIINNTPYNNTAKSEEEKRIYLPMAADYNQYMAIKESTLDNSFVLHGPPGTGKSQTITNIIANALAHGKRVLFVAEKAAALEVVKKRLDALKLSDFCLELHSNKMSKKNILSQFEFMRQLRGNAVDTKYSEAVEKMDSEAAALNEFNDAMHCPRTLGCSAYGAIEGYYGLSTSDLTVERADISAQEKDDFLKLLEDVVTLSTPFEEPKYSPFYILSDAHYTVEDRDKLANIAAQVAKAATKARRAAIKLIENIKSDQEIEELSHNALHTLIDFAFYNDKNAAINRFCGALKTIFSRNYRAYKREPLRETIRQYKLSSPNEYAEILSEFSEFLKVEAQLKKAIGFYKDRHSTLYGFTDYLSTLSRYCMQISSKKGEMREYCLFLSRFYEARRKNLATSILNRYYEGSLKGHQLIDTYLKSLYKLALYKMFQSDERLRQFIPSDHANKVQKFCAYSDFTASLASKEIYRLAASNVPPILGEAATGEPGILLKAVHSGGRDISMRKLFERTANLLSKIKPVMLMSPLSAAQYLSESFPQFDLVIYDEASQLLTAESIGSLSRAKNAIIVGDPNQLPPTTFFKSDTDRADDDFDFVDLDSFLDDAMAVNLPQRYLKWHYRSTHESLIAFSNRRYYQNKLITFPSSDDCTKKVTHKLVQGVYDRGASRTNKGEAEAIVEDLFQRLQSEGESKSFGIIAFNLAQAKLIQDIIDTRLKKEPQLEKYFNKENEPVFVKNIENVQGDERDVIFFSVAYAPDSESRMSANFGALNKNGGWRRLNVALTRSKYEMVIYSCMEGDRIKLSTATSAGAVDLRDFLLYAQSKQGYLASDTDAKGADGVAKMLASKLIEAGFEVRTNVGKSTNKVDVAILGEDGGYKLGILVDNVLCGQIAYTRDREYAKEAFLRRLGWNTIRIYAAELFEDEQRTLRKIINAAQNGVEFFPINVIRQEIEESHGDATVALQEEISIPLIEYERAIIAGGIKEEFFLNGADKKIIEAMHEVVTVEGPIAKKVLYRKIADAWNVRLSERAIERLNTLFKACKFFVNRTMETEFVFSERKAVALTFYRNNATEKRESENICKEEYAAAMLFIVRSCLSLDEDDVIRQTAKQFGFIKTPALSARLGFAVSKLVDEGLIEYSDSGRLSVR